MDNTSSDGPLSTVHEIYIGLEKQGCLDFKMSGHDVDRPPSVMKDGGADRRGLMFGSTY